MEIVNKEVKELIPYEKNPRNNDEAVKYVAESIKSFGFKVPIVIDANNIIVAGHTRLKAAKKLRLATVPCIVADDLTDEQIKAFRLADNKVGEIATWNEELLQLELDDIIGIDMEAFSFEIDDIIVSENEVEIEEYEYDVEMPTEAKAQFGDIYQLGNHRLMCGDSTDKRMVELLTDGELMDLLITDPPYNVDYEGEAGKIQNDNMSNEDFRKFLKSAFCSADSVMKEGAAFYIWHADSEGYNFRGACIDTGWKVRQCLIWNKNTLVMGRQDYHWKHEPCLYGWKDGAGHRWESDRKQTTVLEFEKPQRSTLHPTMKPVALFDYQIKNNTQKGDKVLDLFGGSGTTLIACEQNGRISYNMELDPKYVDVIIDRWEKFTGGKAVLVNG